MSSAQPTNLFLPPATAVQLAAQDPKPRELVYDVANDTVVLGTPQGSMPLAAARDVQFVKGNEINVLDFGAVADYATNNAPFVRAAIARAQELAVGVYFPPGNYAFTEQVDFEGVAFRGAGEGLTLIYTPNLNTAIFKVTVNGEIHNKSFGWMTFANGLAAGATYTDSAAIELAGDSTGYIQNNRFMNMTFLGFYQGILVSKGSQLTQYGLEGMTSKNTFANMTAAANANPGMYLARFLNGSGTANVFHNMGGNAGAHNARSAVIRYEGAGGLVVGDITFADSQLDGPTSAIYIAAGAVYLHNITLPGVQFDSNTPIPIYIEDNPLPLQSIHLVAANIGGGASVAAGLGAYMSQSMIHDLMADEWIVGNEKGSGTGVNVTTLFSVDVGQYSGSSVELIVGGAAIDGAVHIERFLLNRSAAVSLGASHITAAGSATDADPVTISVALSGTVYTFTATFTGTGHGNIEATMVKRLSAVKIQRL